MADLDRFQHDTQGHTMTVALDVGTHRHLQFRGTERFAYWYDVITWPGYLSVTGDCGSYTFTRIEDMFEFFRTDGVKINPSYWSEKCIAAATRNAGNGIEEWDPEGFRRNVVRAFRDWWRDCSDDLRPHRLAAFKQLRREVLENNPDNEYDALTTLGNYVYEVPEPSASYYARLTAAPRRRVFRFEDYWELGVKRYTWSFLWNLRAIVHAIRLYDQAKAPKEEPAHE